MINFYNCKLYCNGDITKIENYDKAVSDNLVSWDCHHRLETHVYVRGVGFRRKRFRDFTATELKEKGLYYNRPPCELIFLKPTDHKYMHIRSLQYERTDEWKKNLSKKITGRKHTEEAKLKMSESWKYRTQHLQTEETRRKISESHKGEKHPLYGKHLSTEYKQKISNSLKKTFSNPEIKEKNENVT